MTQPAHEHPRVSRPARHAPRARRGGAYVFVLGVSMLTALVAGAALTASQTAGRAASGANDAAAAAVLAESAVELALDRVGNNANWRSAYANGVASADEKVDADGYCSFKLVDEGDGNLADAAWEAVRVYGTGRVGSAKRVFSVAAQPKQPLTCLNAALVSSGSLTLISNTVSGGSTVSTNGGLTLFGVTWGTTTFEAALGTTTIGGLGSGARTGGQPPKVLPDASAVFDYYLANGTAMTNVSTVTDLALITSISIQNRLISPSHNPFTGGTNAQGIYVINCGGQNVTVQNCRVVGTLVFRNAGTVTVQNSVNWEPAVTGLPGLLVQGHLALRMTSAALTEASAATEFNPLGMPYPYGGGSGGVANSNTSDSFASRFWAMAYCTGNLFTSGSTTVVRGVLITGGAWAPASSSNLSLTYDATYKNNPPPGFTFPHLVPNSGTWRWEKVE